MTQLTDSGAGGGDGKEGIPYAVHGRSDLGTCEPEPDGPERVLALLKSHLKILSRNSQFLVPQEIFIIYSIYWKFYCLLGSIFAKSIFLTFSI